MRSTFLFWSIFLSTACAFFPNLLAQNSPSSIKIAMLQLNPTVEDYDGNLDRLLAAYHEAVENGATLVVAPELYFPGYPPGDILSDRPEVLSRSLRAMEKLKRALRDSEVPLILGHLAENSQPEGRGLSNQASAIVRGELVWTQSKSLLPTYNVFDEQRFFEAGQEATVFEWDGVRYGILICEDWWFADDHDGRVIYREDPLERFLERNGPADIYISVSASPYTHSKRAYRHQVHAERARKAGGPILWVNQVGATDALLFDGSSFVLDREGELFGEMAAFDERTGYVTFDSSDFSPVAVENFGQNLVLPGEDPEMEIVLQALLTGIRDYVSKTGHQRLVLGLSGGIDSSVVAALAAMAIGAENVTGISMPSRFSSGHSKSDAKLLAESLGIHYFVDPIEDVVERLRLSSDRAQAHLRERTGESLSFGRKMAYRFLPRWLRTKLLGENSVGTPDENLQARARMIKLYNFAGIQSDTLGQEGRTLVLTTGCKSEIAMGWCTKHGDAAGDLNPVGDLWKTEEVALGKYINRRSMALTGRILIPEHILDKRPSPELKPNQFTDDTLPPYEILDPLLADYLDNGLSVEELTIKYGQRLRDQQPWRSVYWVQQVIERLEASEQKRDVAAMILRVSRRSFSQKFRRVPTAKAGEAWAPKIPCVGDLRSSAGAFEKRTARP